MIYKLRNTNIIFLIEHQSKIDYMMSKRIAEYQIEIIKLETLNQKNNKKVILPLIIPIILYTNNKRKWNAHKTITRMQPKIKGYKNLEIGTYRQNQYRHIIAQQFIYIKNFGIRKSKK